MAFDYGTKRIGIAVTDPLQIVASALTTVHPKDIWQFLEEYLQAEQVQTFVVGKPIQMDGTDSQSAPHVLGFIRKLRKTYPQITVEEIDERFTSKLASAAILQSGVKKSKRQEKGIVDTVSATILLQDYLSSRSFL